MADILNAEVIVINNGNLCGFVTDLISLKLKCWYELD
jgi:hypothetical protein